VHVETLALDVSSPTSSDARNIRSPSSPQKSSRQSPSSVLGDLIKTRVPILRNLRKHGAPTEQHGFILFTSTGHSEEFLCSSRSEAERWVETVKSAKHHLLCKSSGAKLAWEDQGNSTISALSTACASQCTTRGATPASLSDSVVDDDLCESPTLTLLQRAFGKLPPARFPKSCPGRSSGTSCMRRDCEKVTVMDLSATSPTLATLDDCGPRSQASQCSNPGYPKRNTRTDSKAYLSNSGCSTLTYQTMSVTVQESLREYHPNQAVLSQG